MWYSPTTSLTWLIISKRPGRAGKAAWPPIEGTGLVGDIGVHRRTREPEPVDPRDRVRGGNQVADRAQGQALPHIVVDEAQDLAPWHWRLLRAAVPATHDNLFLASDAKPADLPTSGVAEAGRRAHRRPIGGVEAQLPHYCRDPRLEHRPAARLADRRHKRRLGDARRLPSGRTRQAAQSAWFTNLTGGVRRLGGRHRGLLDYGVQPDQIGVAARTGALAEAAVSALTAAGVPATSLVKSSAMEGRIAVGTMALDEGPGVPLRRGYRPERAPAAAPDDHLLRGRSGDARTSAHTGALPVVRCLHSRPGNAAGLLAWHAKPITANLISGEIPAEEIQENS
jgi:hypothetical protein